MKISSTILSVCRLSLCLTLLLPAACQQEQDDVPYDGDTTQATGSVEVGFTLTTGSGPATTRVYTEIEAGNDAENYIDIANSNFRFLLFDADNNTYLESFEPASVTPAGTADNGEYQYYYVQGELSQAYENFKLVVLANWPEYPGEGDLVEGTTTIEDVCTAATAAYSYASDFWPSTEDLIPMYGVHTYEDITLTPNLSTDLGTIDLLRAMSKVEVKCSASGFTLAGVTLHNYYTSGTCAPLNVYSNTEENWEANEAIHLPDNPATSAELALTQTDENTYVAYVPEYDNATRKDAYLSVTLTNNADDKEVVLNGDPYIYFKEYDEEGNPVADSEFDLRRNHWYSYTITAVDDEKLTIEYSVQPWNVVESAIGWNPNSVTMAAWSLTPDFEDATEGDEEATYCYVLYPRYKNSEHKELQNSPSYAGFYFQLTEPDGALWEVYLTNTEDFRLNETGTYYDNDSIQRYCAAQGIARSEPYQIQVTATNCWTDTIFTSETSGADATNTDWGNQMEASGECCDIHTDLYIRISIDGGYTWNYLDINPVDDDITKTYWNKSGKRRFAGENKFIRIWQLKAKYNRDYTQLVTELDNSWGIKEYWNPLNIN